MSHQDRDFKGVWLPAKIFLDENLSPVEKILLAEIDSLDKGGERGCFASNAYLGKFIQKTEGTTANIISSLKKRGYLAQCFFDGRVRGLRTCYSVHSNLNPELTKSGKQVSRNRESGVHDFVNIVIQGTNTGEDVSFPYGKESTSACADNVLFAENSQPSKAKLQPKNREEKTLNQSSANFAKKEYDLEQDGKQVLEFLSQQGRAFAPYRGEKPTKALQMTVQGLKQAYRDIVSVEHKEALKSKAMSVEEGRGLAKQLLIDIVAFKSHEWGNSDMSKHLAPETLFKRHLLRYAEQLDAAKKNPQSIKPRTFEERLEAQKRANIEVALRNDEDAPW